MEPKEFIEKAIEGGYDILQNSTFTYTKVKYDHYDDTFMVCDSVEEECTDSISIYEILLDAKAWKAVAKAKRWRHYDEAYNPKWVMYTMIDELAGGATIKSFLKTL